MTLQEFKDRLINVKQCGYGQWIYTFRFYGKKVSVYDTDSTKYDAIKTGEKTCGTTPKQALAVLYRKATR